MRFYLVQIGDLYLTRTGLAGGDPCKLKVRGADALLLAAPGTTHVALDGTVWVQKSQAMGNKGKPIQIAVETYVLKAVWESAIEIINNAISEETNINLIGTGDIGNFNVFAKPLLPVPFAAEDFENGRILQPVFSFITI